VVYQKGNNPLSGMSDGSENQHKYSHVTLGQAAVKDPNFQLS